MSAAGSLSYFFGIGGFLVEFDSFVIATGSMIHCRMSSAESFAPTPSSTLLLPPLPAMEWHIEHFWAAYTSLPLAAASCARAAHGTPATSATVIPAMNRMALLVPIR